MYNKYKFVVVVLFFPVLAVAQTCESLVNQALNKFSFPKIEIKANAGARTYQDIENSKRFYVGLSVSVPLYSGKERLYNENQRLQKKKELLRAISNLKNGLEELELHKQLLDYHKKRVAKAIEDNRELLQELEKITELRGQIRNAEAILKAYGIRPEAAKKCTW